MSDTTNPYDSPNAPLGGPGRPKRLDAGRLVFVEPLAVVVIIGILIGLLSPAVFAILRSARHPDRQSRRDAIEINSRRVVSQGVAERPQEIPAIHDGK